MVCASCYIFLKPKKDLGFKILNCYNFFESVVHSSSAAYVNQLATNLVLRLEAKFSSEMILVSAIAV